MTVPKKRKILKARITHLSLCKAGKNKIAAIYKSDDSSSFQLESIAKMDDKGELTACVYAPNLPDSDNMWADPKTIQEACHEFLTHAIAGRGGIDVSHDYQPLGEADVKICESFLIQKGDPRFADSKVDGRPVDLTGGWGIVLQVLNPQLREQYRSGEWTGISMAGLCLVEKAQEENHMDEAMKQALAALVEQQKATNAALVQITNALKPAAPAPAPAAPADVKVEFDGDPTNAADLAAHRQKIMLAKCDLSTEAGLAKWEAYQASEAKKAKPANKEVGIFAFATQADSETEAAALEKAGREAVARLQGK